jgi:hypothetical protein
LEVEVIGLGGLAIIRRERKELKMIPRFGTRVLREWWCCLLSLRNLWQEHVWKILEYQDFCLRFDLER